MTFLMKWLGLTRGGASVGLRPHREVELECNYDDAYARALAAFEAVLGANVSIDDRSGGTIEAAFGLVNSERIRCSVSRVDETRTHVRIEAHFPAGVDVPASSRAVDALAEALSG